MHPIKDFRSLNKTNDPTAWQLAKREGKTTKQTASMSIELVVSILAFVLIASTVSEPFMKDPLTGLLATAGIIWGFWKLCGSFNAKY